MAGEISAPQSIPNQMLQQQQQQLSSHASQAQETQQIISKLPVGAQIVAQVTGADKNGNLTVRIAGSDLLLSSPIALAKGAALSLRVVNTSDNVSFQLISIDGKLPPTQTQALSNQLLPNPQQAMHQNPQQTVQQNLQQPLQQSQQQGILLRPMLYDEVAQKAIPLSQAAQGQGAQPAANTVATAITQQAVVVSNAGATMAQGIVLTPVPEAIRSIRMAISSTLPADLADDVISQLPQNLNAGSKIDFKITSVESQLQPQQPTNFSQKTLEAYGLQPHEQEVQTGNQVLKGQDFQRQSNEQLMRDNGSGFQAKINVAPDGSLKIPAQVVAVSGGQAVVDTALGRVVISNQFDANRVQVGTVLNLAIDKFVSEELPLQQATIKDLFVEWPALKALGNAMGHAGVSDNMNKLAGLDSIFVSRMAGFFKAVKENNIDNWLSSDLMRDLDPDSLDAIKAKMTGDFANLTRLYHDSNNTGWNTVLFPVYDGKELHQAHFYVKDLQDEESVSTGKRFVVEITTGAFGEVQLDGLVRKNMAQNRFDLMVRTGNKLPEDVRMGITEIFTNAAEITGIKGGVDFGNLDSAIRPASAVLAEQIDHSGLQV